MEPESQAILEDNHGGIYWFFYNIKNSIVSFGKNHKKFFISLIVLFILSLIYFRADVQPLVIICRRYLGVVVIGLPIIFFSWLLVRHRSWKYRLSILIIYLVIGWPAILFGRGVHNYFSLYYRYSTLSMVDLNELPLSDYERIQPLNSIYSLAHEVMTESESPTVPNFVKFGDEYRWTMAIEPSYPLSRMFGNVHEIFSIPGTAPSPNFSRDNRVAVDFEVSENLMFSHNTKRAITKRFGLWNYLNCETADVTYIPDDNGRILQVVSLIKWQGIIFPRPVFGGVVVIEQSNNSWLSWPKLLFTGIGEIIKPNDIHNYPYLIGQNILPYEVSRYVAKSLCFQNGFLAPFPGYHKGDVRIPDLPMDVNEQPFSTYFRIVNEGIDGKLYHYFALEPFDPDKQGLNTSLFVPADGIGDTYIYHHYERSGSLTGVSAISSRVMESKKNYDWSMNYPVEHRPFIKNIGGQNRFFWLTTIVTRKEGGSHFIAGNIPELVITDASYNTPVWVDSKNPSSWLEALEVANKSVWQKK